MTVHHSHLHPEPFSLVSSGKKTLESRVFDEKRRTFKVGDQIIFINRANEAESVTTLVTALHKADSFRELFADESLRNKCSSNSLDVLLEGVGKYYSEEEQRTHGVVGIEFAIIHS